MFERTVRSRADVERLENEASESRRRRSREGPERGAVEGKSSHALKASDVVPGPDGYKERLLKYIPAESVALYLTLDGICRASWADEGTKLWKGLLFSLLLVLVLTPLYLRRVGRVEKRGQIAMSTLAFVVWVAAVGGWFATLSWWEPAFGSIALVVVTALLPLIEDPPA